MIAKEGQSSVVVVVVEYVWTASLLFVSECCREAG